MKYQRGDDDISPLFPYIKSGHYNDDNVPRNYLHGAYEVSKIETINPEIAFDIKRFFIHRKNYFIFQYQDDSLEDFHLEIDTDKKQFNLVTYDGKNIKSKYPYENS